MMKLPVQSEEQMVQEFVNWLATSYPNALVHIDFGSGAYLNKSQAIKQSLFNKRRGHPDFIAYEPRCGYVGLAIEAKREGEKIYQVRNHMLPATPHIGEQMEYLLLLEARGWYTAIVSGIDDMILLTTTYLNGQIDPRFPQEEPPNLQP